VDGIVIAARHPADGTRNMSSERDTFRMSSVERSLRLHVAHGSLWYGSAAVFASIARLPGALRLPPA
jgi:hypothetical protein